MLHAILVAPNLRGLVLETFGAGNAPKGRGDSITKALSDAVSRGIVIVNVTQCLSGNVGPFYAPATVLRRAGVVLGYDMTTEAALTKLAYLLSQEQNGPADVAREMARDLRGEMTEQMATEFRHPDEIDMKPKRVTLMALKCAIEDGDLESYKALSKDWKKVGLSDTDEVGDTILVSWKWSETVQSVADL